VSNVLWLGLVTPLMLLGFLLAMHSVEQRVFPSTGTGTDRTDAPQLALAPAAPGGDLIGLAMTPDTGPLVSAQ
jgi:hypothetical protein